MTQTPEKTLEEIMSKLKENTTYSEKATDPIDRKIDNLVRNVRNLIEKEGTADQMRGILYYVLNGLENIRDDHAHYVNSIIKDYRTYVHVLERLQRSIAGNAGDSKIEDKPSREQNVFIPESSTQTQEPIEELSLLSDEKQKEKLRAMGFP